MKDELIKYHEAKLKKVEDGLESWIKPSVHRDTTQAEHIETLKQLIQFHKDALTWLRSL